MSVSAFLPVLILAQAPADLPPPLPDGVRAIIEAAIGSGDAKTIETIIRLARGKQHIASAQIDDITKL